MNTRRPLHPPGAAGIPEDAGLRRTRYGSMAAVLITSYTAILLFIAAIATRTHERWDVTSTREHSLSERTQRILNTLHDPVEVVVSTDPTKSPPESRQQLWDLLQAFTMNSKKLSVVAVDAGGPNAAADITSVVRRLADQRKEIVERDHETLSDIQSQIIAIAEHCPTIGSAAEALAQSLSPNDSHREALAENAVLTRAMGADLTRAAEGVKEATSGEIAGVSLPQGDLAQRAAQQPLTDVATVSDRLGKQLESLANDTARALAKDVNALRDAALAAADSLSQLKPLEPLMVARLLQQRQAILVTSASGVQAIDVSALFPSSQGTPGRAQVMFAGEELIGSAIAALSSPVTPILVIVHAETDALIENGRPTRAAATRFARLADRMQLRRVDLAEWAVARNAARPDLSALDPQRKRPVVWFVLGAPPRVALTTKGDAAAERATRIGKLAAATRGLIDGGESVLLNVEPSELPGSGEPDPLVEPLKALGVNVDSARPIIERMTAQGTPQFSTYQTIRQAPRGHPVAEAIDGLAVVLHWAMPINLAASPPVGVTLRPLLQVEASDSRWGESQWTSMRYLNARAPLTPISPRDPPTRNEGRDLTKGPFTLAASIERLGSSDHPQRVIVVAAPSWYEDIYSLASGVVDGRRASIFPGNAELLDTSISWLGHLDDVIAPGARARDIPRIKPLTQGQLALIRWGLIGGLPVSVLLVGMAARWASNRRPKRRVTIVADQPDAA